MLHIIPVLHTAKQFWAMIKTDIICFCLSWYSCTFQDLFYKYQMHHLSELMYVSMLEAWQGRKDVFFSFPAVGCTIRRRLCRMTPALQSSPTRQVQNRFGFLHINGPVLFPVLWMFHLRCTVHKLIITLWLMINIIILIYIIFSFV